MAEFQWWLLLVGLVAGGGLVAVVSMDSRRREQDISELEQRAEAAWIADQLGGARGPDPSTVESVLRAHREYLSLQPPDRLIVEEEDSPTEYALDPVAQRPYPARYEPNDDLDREPDLDRDPELDRDPALDRDPDRQPDHVRDDGRRGADQHLPRATEQQASTRQEAHAGADREQRRDR
jgi:hypothetical protein